jgi:hypothetical protein
MPQRVTLYTPITIHQHRRSTCFEKTIKLRIPTCILCRHFAIEAIVQPLHNVPYQSCRKLKAPRRRNEGAKQPDRHVQMSQHDGPRKTGLTLGGVVDFVPALRGAWSRIESKPSGRRREDRV